MRKLLVAMIIGGAAIASAAPVAAQVVRDGPLQVREVRLRAPQAGMGQRHVVMRSREMRRGDHRRFHRIPGYRMMRRGAFVPNYWWGPQFGIGNWNRYGFARPGQGTRWVRYYDDALLIDGHGRVHDGRYGMDWDRFGDRYSDDHGYAERFERDGGRHELRYDRNYPYDYPYGGARQAYGWAGGGYTVTETTVTTPTIVRQVEYIDDVAVHRGGTKRHHKARKPGHRAKAARCFCK